MSVSADLRTVAVRAASRPFYLASLVWPLASRQPDPWAWIAERAGVAGEAQSVRSVVLAACRGDR